MVLSAQANLFGPRLAKSDGATKAGVPESVEFATKTQIALAQLDVSGISCAEVG
ncbi:hypothetical protein [Burkholderia ubonensis]|uniref:hypothetical protein n=1 Tax=Burkholderia ubonensis TaxID=101571 RepID=UPI000AB62B51|nr:hypothetical protein [Burkholderia ubonensis]